MNTTRAEVLEEFAARVMRITLANGFETEAGAKVFLGEAPPLGPDDPDQAIAIVPGDEQQEWMEGGRSSLILFPVRIEGLMKVEIENAWLGVEAMIRDIKRAVETADVMFGGLLTAPLERGPVRTLSRQAGSENAGAGLTYTSRFEEGWGLP